MTVAAAIAVNPLGHPAPVNVGGEADWVHPALGETWHGAVTAVRGRTAHVRWHSYTPAGGGRRKPMRHATRVPVHALSPGRRRVTVKAPGCDAEVKVLFDEALHPRAPGGQWTAGGGHERHAVPDPAGRVRMNLEGTDAHLAGEVEARTRDFAAGFPAATKTLRAIRVAKLSDNLPASTSTGADGTSVITLNSTYYGDRAGFESVLAAMHEDGRHPLPTTQAVIDHELGHVLDAAAYDGSSGSLLSNGSAWQDPAALVRRFGKYSANRHEAFGEAFSVHMAGGSVPDEMLRSFGVLP